MRPMTSLAPAIALLSALGLLVACGDDVVDDGGDSPRPTDVGTPADSEGESEGAAACADGLTTCDGECVDLQTNDGHCGACGHTCKDPGTFGRCEAGACPSALFCTARDTSLVTCDDVCATHGQRCDDGPPVDGRGCADRRYMFWSDESYDAAFMDCLNHAAAWQVYDPCSEPIDWQIFIDTIPFSEAVACCCTQDLLP